MSIFKRVLGAARGFRSFTSPISISTRNRTFNIAGARVNIPGIRLFGGGSAGWRGISGQTQTRAAVRGRGKVKTPAVNTPPPPKTV